MMMAMLMRPDDSDGAHDEDAADIVEDDAGMRIMLLTMTTIQHHAVKQPWPITLTSQ
ncbi:hypothetical protein N9L68_00215 [bacterium]|nr:hypothetical protein [bacterium]